MQLSELIRRYLLYGLSGPIIVLNLWVLGQLFNYFEGVITFTILSIILSLILDYLVKLFERLGSNRTQAVLLVLGVFWVTLVVLGFTLIPIVIEQATQLVQGLPTLLEAGGRNLNQLQSFINYHNLPFDLNQINEQINNQTQVIVAELPELAINTLGQIFATVLLIVLAFYMLLYGERCWKGVINLLPAKLAVAVSQSLRQQFHQFFLSQLLLALVMVLFLTPTFLILQIKFALLFVLVIGLLQVVPLFGATVGIGLVGLLVLGLQGFIPSVQVLVASIVFQQITDNVIAPRVRGGFTGLNPIWIIIALLIGGRVAGFIGVVLAMPIAAAIKSTIETLRLPDELPAAEELAGTPFD